MQGYTTASAQTTAPPTTATMPGVGPAATQSSEASNIQPASSLGEAIPGLGATATVVLDAMPLDQSVPLALDNLEIPEVYQWLFDLSWEEVVVEAQDAVVSWLSQSLDGKGIELSSQILLAVGIGVAVDDFAGVGEQMTQSGRMLFKNGMLELSLSGALSDLLQGTVDLGVIGVSGMLTETQMLSAKWLLGLDQLVQCVGANVVDLLSNDLNPLSTLQNMLPLLSSLVPIEASGMEQAQLQTGQAIGSAMAPKGLDPLGEAQVQELANLGVRLGYSAEGVFAEVSGAAQIQALAALGPAGSTVQTSDLAWGEGLSIRVMASSLTALLEQGLSAAWFSVTWMAKDSNCKADDQATADSWDGLVALLSGGAGVALDPAEIPDQTLSRSFSFSAWDPTGSLVQSWGVASAQATAGVQITLEGTLKIGPDAIASALSQPTLIPDTSTPEAASMEVARAIAGEILSPRYEVPADLDLDAGIEMVALEEVTETTTASASLGGAGVASLEAAVRAEAQVSVGLISQESLPQMSISELQQYIRDAQLTES